MTEELLRLLREITPEEKRIRSGNKNIEKAIYSSEKIRYLIGNSRYFVDNKLFCNQVLRGE